MEDLIDDNNNYSNHNWINVQDPIKQMFLSLTKAIRSHSAGIRDLDKKLTGSISSSIRPEGIEKMIHEYMNLYCCSKADATAMIYKSQSDHSAMESKLNMVILN